MQIITSNLEYREALSQNTKVIIEFFTDNDPSCQSISEEFKQLAEEYPDIAFLLVNVEYNSGIASSENIKAVPTFVSFRDGKQIFRFVGANRVELLRNVNQLNNV